MADNIIKIVTQADNSGMVSYTTATEAAAKATGDLSQAQANQSQYSSGPFGISPEQMREYTSAQAVLSIQQRKLMEEILGTTGAAAKQGLQYESTSERAMGLASTHGEVFSALKKNVAAYAEQTASINVSSLAMQEMVVVARELERGNFSRIPGSLTRMAQGFGALNLIMNPVTIGLVAAGAAFYETYKWIEESSAAANRLTEQYNDLQDTLTGFDGLKDFSDQLSAIALKAPEVATTVNTLAKAVKDLSDATNAANEILKQNTQQGQEEDQVRKKIELDKIRADELAGKISPAEAERRRGIVEQKYAARTDRVKSEEEQGEIDNLKKEKDKQQAIADDAKAKSDAARTSITGDTVAAQEAKDKAAEAKKAHDEKQKFIKEHGSELSPEEYQKQLDQLRLLDAAAVQAEAKAQDAQAKLDKDKKDYQASDAAAKAAQARADELGKQITSKETAHKSADEHRKTMEGLGAEAGQQEYSNKVTEMVQQEEKKNAALEKIFDMYAGGHQVFMAIIKNHIEKSTTTQQELNALGTALKTLEHSQHVLRNTNTSG